MTKKSLNTPRAKFTDKPFVNGYTDIEKGNTVFTIGNSGENEDIWADNPPDYVKMRCKLSAKAAFPDVTISAGYRTTPSGQDFVMQKKLYDGSEISMNNIVSEVNIEFLECQTLDYQAPNFQSDCTIAQNELLKNPVIYRKVFQIQNISKRLPNYPDTSNEQSEIFTTKSEAHPFAGMYFTGIKLSNIQPYLFYVGTNLQTKPYVKIISAKEAIRENSVKICKDIDVDALSTLEDDICNGKVKFTTDETTYTSIFAQKDTLISDVFTILFKKVND